MMAYNYYVTPDQYDTATMNGISIGLVNWRVHDGAWKIERAISTPPRSKTPRTKWLEVAKQNGICRSTFTSRVLKGMELEKAATKPLTTKAEILELSIVKHRVYPLYYVDLANRNGISKTTYVSRVRRGWKPQEAATRAIDLKRLVKGRRDTPNGL